MKTFETEKGNIPEGATHYANETDTGCFIWYREGTNEIMVNGYTVNEWESAGKDEDLSDLEPIPSVQTETPEEKEALDAIEKVEWKNGDSCRYANDTLQEYIYIGEHPHGDGHYVFSEDKGVTYIANGYLLEPETPEAKKEREELEAAYELYCEVRLEYAFDIIMPREAFDSGIDGNKRNEYLAIVRKTGYRKGE